MTGAAWIGTTSLFEVAGMTIVHFLWQGTVVAAAVALVLAMLDRRGARERYAVSLAGMIAMLAAPVITFYTVFRSGGEASGAIPGDLAMPEAMSALSLEQFLAPLLPWIAVFWLTGAATLQLRLLIQWMTVQQLRRSARSESPERWQFMVDELRRRLGISRAVKIAESALVAVPSVAGSLRPIILMPAGVMSALTPAMLRGIIAHELAHIRRHDYAVNLLQNVFESLLFFHPAVWWLSHRIRVEREFCCDDLALAHCGDRAEYARALHELDQFRFKSRQFVPAFTGGSLMDRIARIAGIRLPSGRRVHGAWLAPLVALLLVGTAWSAVQHGPGDIHTEHPDVLIPEMLGMQEEMYVLQSELGDLEDLEVFELDDLEELQAIKLELQEDMEDLRVDLLPSHRAFIPRVSTIRAPRGITILGDRHSSPSWRVGNHFEHLEYLEHSRELFHNESMSIVEDLLDGDISSKDAVKKMEELVKEFRENEAEAEKMRKKTMVERAEAEYEAEMKARERAEEKYEVKKEAREKARKR